LVLCPIRGSKRQFLEMKASVVFGMTTVAAGVSWPFLRKIGSILDLNVWKHSSSPEKPVALPACQKKSGGPRQRAFAIPGRPATSKICRLREPRRRPLLETEGEEKEAF